MSKRALTILLACASALFSADPYVGTWKFNTAKSLTTSTGPFPKEQTIVIKQEGDEFIVALTGTSANDRPLVNKFSVHVEGGSAKLIESTSEGITVKRLGPNVTELVYLSGGKEGLRQFSIVSGDGKTLCLINRSSNAKGITGMTLNWFDKTVD